MAKNKLNQAMINEAWGPTVKAILGNKIDESSDRFNLMCQIAHNQATFLNEDSVGGVSFPFQTAYNTNGIGNPVPASMSAMTGAEQGSLKAMGSGDKWPALMPMALQVAARTIGFDLVNTIPTQGPTYVLPFLDYVYAGSKDAYGATPSYNGATANPQIGTKLGEKVDPAYGLYEAPHAFRCKITNDASKAEYIQALKDQDTSVGYIALTANGKTMNVQFISLSRIGADPMFKVCGDSKNVSLGSLFGADASIDVTFGGKSFSLFRPRLISALEDQILGFTGAGKYDSDRWSGTFQNDEHLFEPMDRATGEMQYARQMSLKVFTKWGNVGTLSASTICSQEQIQDLQKQWGIDVIKICENTAINELSQTINKWILSRLFALGWRNHVEAYESEGVCLNLSLTGTATTKTCVTFFDEEMTEKQVTMPVPAMQTYGQFENDATTFKKVADLFLYAGNIIMNRGRRGPANFAVCNAKIATMLQSNAQYAFSPFANTMNQNNGQIYPVGTVYGINLMVDPLMALDDTRILVGRKGAKDEPGVIFCPYIMAESVRLITEGMGMPKVIVKSRASLVNTGFYPELNYLTFYIKTPDQIV